MPSLTDTLRGAAPGSVDEAAIISQLDAASCGAADGRGCRALHYLAWKLPSPLALAAALAAAPDAASAADGAGWLPLHYAAWAKAPLDAVELLLAAHPAAAAATNARGFLPLHMAVQSGAPDAVVGKLLDAHPAGVSAKTSNGDTPLALATASGADATMLESDEAAVRRYRPLTHPRRHLLTLHDSCHRCAWRGSSRSTCPSTPTARPKPTARTAAPSSWSSATAAARRRSFTC